MMRPLATFSFFSNFFIFSLSSSLVPLVPPSSSFPVSSFLLPPPSSSFLLLPRSSSSLLPPRPALSKSFSIRKVHFSLILTKALRTDYPTNQPTNQPTDRASYRDTDASKKWLLMIHAHCSRTRSRCNRTRGEGPEKQLVCDDSNRFFRKTPKHRNKIPYLLIME